MTITAPKTSQLTLDFAPGLVDGHRNLREVIAAGIYKRGLSKCAIDLNESPGNLSNQLGDDSPRKFGVDDLETYMDKSRDFTPIYYLIEKYLADPQAKRDAARDAVVDLLKQISPQLQQAGLI